MAKKPSNLEQRVSSLLDRGKTMLQVINAIRKSKEGKNTTTTNIKNAIARIRASEKAASLIGGMKSSDPIKKTLNPKIIGGGKTARATFRFQFDFAGGGSTKKGGRQAVYLTLDLPANATKGELLKAMQDAAKDWIENHYQGDPEGRSSVRITITTIKGV